MAKITPSQHAALDILDWLHFNQALVHFVYSATDRKYLEELVARLQEAVAATGATGIDAEVMKHYALGYLEIGLSDEMVPATDVDGNMLKLRKFNKDFLTASILAYGKVARDYDSATAWGIAELLRADVAAAPVAVRFRLAERCLALEYPDAARTALVWFAQSQVLPCAKYRQDFTAQPSHDAIVARIGLLCEFDIWRKSLRRTRKGNGAVDFMFDRIANEQPDSLSKMAVLQAGKLLAAKFYGIEPPDNKSLTFRVERAADNDYVGQFLGYANTMWSRRRLCEGTAMAWVGIIGAFEIALARRDSLATPVYNNAKAGASLAEQASATMAQHGLTIQARALYLAYSQFDQLIWPRIATYYEFVKTSAGVIPADDDDFWYFMLLVAIGRSAPQD